MKLSAQEAELFYNLTWKLQFFVGKRLGMIKDIETVEEYGDSPRDRKVEIRQAVYDNPSLIASFVKENPFSLSRDQLDIVENWTRFISGRFYIERLLKKYAIFISETDDVYAVHGLNQGLDEIVPPSYLPVMVEAVLLPFAGKIVYDGLLSPYNIHFGGGIRKNLKEAYMIAKQNHRIIESFEPAAVDAPPKMHVFKSWRSEIQELHEKSRQLKSGTQYPPMYGAAFGLVKASLDFAQATVADSPDLDAQYKALKKINRELRKAYAIFDREGW